MQPVVRMRSVVRAFRNVTSCVYVEPGNRSTYVVPELNGSFFGAYCILLPLFSKPDKRSNTPLLHTHILLPLFSSLDMRNNTPLLHTPILLPLFFKPDKRSNTPLLHTPILKPLFYKPDIRSNTPLLHTPILLPLFFKPTRDLISLTVYTYTITTILQASHEI